MDPNMVDPQGGQPPPDGGAGHGPPAPHHLFGPAPVGKAPAASGSPTRAIIGIVLLLLLSTALCLIVVLAVRQWRAKAPAAAASAPAASASAETPVLRGTVVLKEGNTKAVIRREPAFDAPVVLLVPAGTVVEMTNSVTAKGQTWCRVRTQGPPPASGWMHADVLKFD